MDSFLLSVVIPHKDIPELLRRCLESVPRRDDVQVIVADDCSACDTPSLVMEWGFTHVETYRLDTQQGGGGARNLGLAKARGRWITFLDADDFLTPAADSIFDSLKHIDADVDVVYCAGCSVDSQRYTCSDRADWLNRQIERYASKPHDAEMRLRYTFGEPWCKIVRRSLVQEHDISFDLTPIHNDTRYSYMVGHYARRVKVEPHALCTITTRTGSVSKQLPEANKLHRIRVFGEEEMFFERNGIPHRYQIRFLWAQMARSLTENRQTYRKGVRILRDLGVKDSRRRLMTAKHLVRNSLVKMAKRVLRHTSGKN